VNDREKMVVIDQAIKASGMAEMDIKKNYPDIRQSIERIRKNPGFYSLRDAESVAYKIKQLKAMSSRPGAKAKFALPAGVIEGTDKGIELCLKYVAKHKAAYKNSGSTVAPGGYNFDKDAMEMYQDTAKNLKKIRQAISNGDGGKAHARTVGEMILRLEPGERFFISKACSDWVKTTGGVRIYRDVRSRDSRPGVKIESARPPRKTVSSIAVTEAEYLDITAGEKLLADLNRDEVTHVKSPHLIEVLRRGRLARDRAWKRHDSWHDKWEAATTDAERARIEAQTERAESGMRRYKIQKPRFSRPGAKAKFAVIYSDSAPGDVQGSPRQYPRRVEVHFAIGKTTMLYSVKYFENGKLIGVHENLSREKALEDAKSFIRAGHRSYSRPGVKVK
jgi:hypothetical protein